MRGKNRIPELDGLRVLMIAIVSWYHIWQQSWLFPRTGLSDAARDWLQSSLGIDGTLDWLVRTGYVWVDGTVLLSVFLLFLPFAEAKRSGAPAPAAGDFYYRRARRILPAYYFIVLCHLLFIALPYRGYGDNMPWMVQDLVTHLTFTFTRYRETNLYTQLDGAAWTVAMLVQGYLLFPLMARGVRKHPVPVLGGMLLACFGFRAWCVWGLQDHSMVVNQLINFLDVYVIGILCAMIYTEIRARQTFESLTRDRRYAAEAGATLLFFVSLYGLVRMLQLQSKAQHLQAWQMMYRPVFALCFAGLVLSAPFMLWPFRKLLGNPVTRFLAGISMNYYLIHQSVAVHLKTRLRVPWTDSWLGEDFLVYGKYPNQTWDTAWQERYTLLCFGVSLVMAVAVTYLVEKPGARLMNLIRKRLAQRRAS